MPSRQQENKREGKPNLSRLTAIYIFSVFHRAAAAASNRHQQLGEYHVLPCACVFACLFGCTVSLCYFNVQ
jgi:hypothetical protein